jgi:hypothetical protein
MSDLRLRDERGGPFTTTGFAFLLSRAGVKAGLLDQRHDGDLRGSHWPVIGMGVVLEVGKLSAVD